MSLLPPILEGRISNFHQNLGRFSGDSSPKIPSITSGETCINCLSSGDVNLSSGVITFCKNEDKKSKFAEDFWLYNGLSMSYVSIML